MMMSMTEAELLDATSFAKQTALIVALVMIGSTGDPEGALGMLAGLDLSSYPDPDSSAICKSLCEQAIREAMAAHE